MERGNSEIATTFHALGGEAYKQSDYLNVLRAQGKVDFGNTPGYPDYRAELGPFFFYIEAKAADGNLAFSQFSPDQRAWMNKRPDDCWVWIWMGTDRAGSQSPNARSAWFAPWPHWLTVEQHAGTYGLAGLALHTPHALEHRALGLFIKNLLREYALNWIGGGVWDIPPAHIFWRLPLRRVPLFAQQRELLFNRSAHAALPTLVP